MPGKIGSSHHWALSSTSDFVYHTLVASIARKAIMLIDCSRKWTLKETRWDEESNDDFKCVTFDY